MLNNTTSQAPILTAVSAGSLAAALLLMVYAGIVTAVSGWGFAQIQFASTWYFIVSLALGFGFQVGLYVYLKKIMAGRRGQGKIVAVSGTTSTTAMIACCSHYLANVTPLLGVAGAISIIGQYQQQLFWVGLLFNFAGIAYLVHQLIQFKKHQ